MKNSKHTEKKYCPDCDKFLPIINFRIKGLKKDQKPRYDKYCLVHRRERDKSALTKRSNTSKSKPREVIYHKQPCSRKHLSSVIEPKKLDSETMKDSVDYSIWDKMYGSKQSELDKIEIKTNMTEFFNLLIREHCEENK